MSQLVKLKASLPTHLIRPTTLASAILGHNQPTTNGQQRSANSINRRGLTTNAHKAQQQHNTITHAASSQSHSSSSSSSSSSFTSSLLFGLLGLGAVGGAFLANQETVHAEAASDPLALPAINLDSDASVSSGGVTTTKKKSGGRKKTKQRKQLDYPGKLAKLHQFNEQLVEVRVGQGFRFQLQASAYPHDPLADKTVVLIPICELGGPQGPLMQWIASTSLGRKHSFEGYSDSAGNSSGHYKYTSDAGFSIKPSFQLSAHGNVAVLDMDYKRKEQAYTLNVNTTGDITTTFNQSLTPNLVGGVELHFAPMGFVHLNGGAKYTTADKVEQYVFTKKDAKMMASYSRLISSTPHPLAQFGFPDLSTHVGIASSYSLASQKSDFQIGLRHARASYNYQAAFSTLTPAVQMSFDGALLADAPNIRWGLTGQVNYDGSGESVFGVSVSAQL